MLSFAVLTKTESIQVFYRTCRVEGMKFGEGKIHENVAHTDVTHAAAYHCLFLVLAK